jgi:hypothetical protein
MHAVLLCEVYAHQLYTFRGAEHIREELQMWVEDAGQDESKGRKNQCWCGKGPCSAGNRQQFYSYSTSRTFALRMHLTDGSVYWLRPACA